MIWIVYLIGFGAGMLAGLWTAYVISRYRKTKDTLNNTESAEESVDEEFEI